MSNPFAALIEDATPRKPNEVCDKLENIFGFTLNKAISAEKGIPYLEEQAATFPGRELDLEILEHALFERLIYTNPENYIQLSKSPDGHVFETQVVVYLYGCYVKNNENKHVTLRKNVNELIMRNILTSLKQPDLYADQNLSVQFYGILKNPDPNAVSFFNDIYETTLKDEDGIAGMEEPYMKILKLIHVDIARFTITSFSFDVLNVLQMFTTSEQLACVFLNYCQPKDGVGIEYSNTLLGALFSISSLPKTLQGEYEFFQDPLNQGSNSATEGVLNANVDKITQYIHLLILSLLKCSARTKSTILSWLGNCLKANAGRGKLWNAQTMEITNPTAFTYVSDGFMINMLTVIMKFCQPFCSMGQERKILKVDPTYCAVNNETCQSKDVHMTDLFKETCLVPNESEDSAQMERLTASTYSFVTECFYMGHRAFDLGYRVVVDKLVKLNQEMVRIERAYNDAASQSNEVADTIKTRMTAEMQKYLSMKASLSEPVLLDMLFSFISASSLWFNQVAIHDDFHNNQYAPLNEKEITFPVNQKVPDTLKCIPEFIVENIVCYLVFLRRFNPKFFEMQGYDRLKPILTFVVMYMGSPQRVKNPHLRAHLAEALEALLPFHKDEPPGLNTLGGYQREMLFKNHEHRQELVRSLLEVFVGIEMTGQSVQFEQKFNYRRPMYMVMDYLWELPEHQNYFQQLAVEAESNMDAMTPPLFLRFVNLLLNDAVFLLDEALSNMSKLREMETARENGEWNGLSFQERTQNLGSLQHIGMIARFDNILGRDTIRTLVCLTSKITTVFTHSAMVDRVAAMLNYFLLNLVGPNQKNFKVKDQKEYSFEPAATVLDICKIYVNLKESEAFCLAVSQDGRSYSPQLFKLAEDVLVRIGGGSLIGELQEVASIVAEKSVEYQANEQFISDAPEHFLDPIMSTLMLDPVLLPSSKQTVDRTTIARHLLSDQTDPFNRSPLTLDQVVPNKELADEIKQWIAEKKCR